MTLKAAGLSFSYDRAGSLISDWTQEFLNGEVVAVTGPSGRGKSTLLYLLGLMLKPTKGEVLVDGLSAADLSDTGRTLLRADTFGFVFQDAALDSSRTVLDNVLETALYRGEPRKNSIERAIALLDEFGVELRAAARPGQISGGQAQRIALCRALLVEPKIILADEPTGNLDTVSSDVVVSALRSRAENGAVVVIVTHDQDLVRKCDRVVDL